MPGTLSFRRLNIGGDILMRLMSLVALSAAALLSPQFAGADPAQQQAVQSAGSAPTVAATTPASSSTVPAPAATGSAMAAPAPGAPREVVKVTATRPTDDLDVIECRTSPPETGTRLGGSRECHTVRDWKVRQQQAQDMLAHNQSNGMQQPLRTH
jgi:hypothetical protein